MSRRTEVARKSETPARREAVGGVNRSKGGTSQAATEGPAPATRERIEARAFEIYLARNGGQGDALSDWLQAEREIGGSKR